MIKIENPINCCGCTACESICNNNAIVMKPDALGFLYPEVDARKCTSCGLCEKICSFNDRYDTSLNFQNPFVYGARHKDIKEVETSRSGAAFIALSDYILEKGGVVYGVGYEQHFCVVHKRATTKEGRNEFKGSKYVQSNLKDTFLKVKQDLKDGLLVMFSGTPCQVAGLKSYISKQLRENLFLVDIVCHGVPSPYIWKDYLTFIEKKYCGHVTSVDFRNKKDYGWTSHKESFVVNGQIVTTEWLKNAFYKHIMLRPSCGNCHYCNLIRPGDITLADFWGWEKTDSQINEDDKGVSLVFVNTNKGKQLFEEVQNDLVIIPAKIENSLQPNLISPSQLHPKHKKFENDYCSKGFSYIYSHLDDYDKPTFWERYRIKMKLLFSLTK